MLLLLRFNIRSKKRLVYPEYIITDWGKCLVSEVFFINKQMRVITTIFCMCLLVSTAFARPPTDHDDFEKPLPLPVLAETETPVLKIVSDEQWDRQAVRGVLQAFAYGGQSTDAQIGEWAAMAPADAIAQMLTFEPVNLRLSPQGASDPSTQYCGSLEMLQDFWSSNDPQNPMRVGNRPWYQTLDQDEAIVTPIHLFLTWSRLAHTPGCNTFLHKLAFYITNYHASIHIQNTAPTLMRSYYDDVVQALEAGYDFVDLMTLSATHASLAIAYGHMDNYFDENGGFQGNDDFAREYLQLLFGIEGTSEDPDYHEDVTIEHNAWLLTGMALDAELNAWGSENRLDWLVAPIVFTDHFDPAGRQIWNHSAHYDAQAGDASCLEILHQTICGRTARDKLFALGPVAAAHPESMANTPLKIIRFFADEQPNTDNTVALQNAWEDAAYDLLAFLRAYAISTAFHQPDTFKLHSAFDRNLLIHNANQLTAEEAYAESFAEGPTIRMYEQGALVFAPIHNVFGGQTGTDASNDRYVFKKSWDGNITNSEFLAKTSESYRLEPDGPVFEWRKDWGSVIPVNNDGEHVVSAVGEWLWNRFINDDGRNYDAIAKAQVHAMLATGIDFGAVADENNMEAVYSSSEISSGELAELNQSLAAETMDFSTTAANVNVGMVINFITALPYTFATGKQ